MNLAAFEHTGQGLAWLFANPIALLVILAVFWFVSLQIWPKKKCPRCKAAGFRSGWIGVRECGRCGGSGLVPRMFSGKK